MDQVATLEVRAKRAHLAQQAKADLKEAWDPMDPMDLQDPLETH